MEKHYICHANPFFGTVAFHKLRTFYLPLHLLFSTTTAYANSCDTGLLERSNSGVKGYKDRGEICEGLYESPVSADFELVSLLEHPLTEYKKGDVIIISAPNIAKEFGASSISIRGLALRPQLYYRMDSNFEGKNQINWSVETVLDPIKLNASELGIYGWHETPKGLSYIPVSAEIAGKNLESFKASEAEVIIRAAVPIQKVAWRFLGEASKQPYNNIRLSYAVRDPIRIPINWPNPRPETVKIEVAAKPLNSTEWLIQVFNITLPITQDTAQ